MASMRAWLDPLRQALDESDARIDFFFRDDDVGWSNDQLRELLACFHQYAAPVDLAAIPAAFTAELADELCAMHAAAPGLIGIHQHGFAHTNHEVSGRKCEFGTSRTGEEQYRDIQLGKLKLQEMLGSAVGPIFTPPWNRCTKETGECLRLLGFRVLSRDSTALPLALSGLTELPISIDWFAKKKGSRLSRECIGAAMAGTVKESRPIGIMLHHELMDADERHALGDFLRVVTAHPQAHCNLMHEVAERYAAEGESLSAPAVGTGR